MLLGHFFLGFILFQLLLITVKIFVNMPLDISVRARFPRTWTEHQIIGTQSIPLPITPSFPPVHIPIISPSTIAMVVFPSDLPDGVMITGPLPTRSFSIPLNARPFPKSFLLIIIIKSHLVVPKVSVFTLIMTSLYAGVVLGHSEWSIKCWDTIKNTIKETGIEGDILGGISIGQLDEFGGNKIIARDVLTGI
ncbi:hypothetical protein HanIR_Chr01g0051031 [Helianthus annuus]|nr:hypothetical protein HanIR_Chr01g0051031 [Helianthus annuus]